MLTRNYGKTCEPWKATSSTTWKDTTLNPTIIATEILLAIIASACTVVAGLIVWLIKQNGRIKAERDQAVRKLHHKLNGKVSSEKLSLSKTIELLQKQNEKCALTGIELKPENATLDRISSTVGDYTNGHVQMVLKEVGAMKSAIKGDQLRFIQLCRAVAYFADTKEQGQKK